MSPIIGNENTGMNQSKHEAQTPVQPLKSAGNRRKASHDFDSDCLKNFVSYDWFECVVQSIIRKQ